MCHALVSGAIRDCVSELEKKWEDKEPKNLAKKPKILVIGSGGRECAIVWKLNQSPQKPEIICIPGNAGISKLAKCVDGDISDIKALVEFALNNSIDLTVVGPELPLSLGIVDEFQKVGLRIFGPNKKSAELESSKISAKIFMAMNDIPTSRFRTFSNFNSAKKYISTKKDKYVIKVDGLAAGKGVYICSNNTDGEKALKEIMLDKKFGESGNNVLIEEFIGGFESSCMMFMDGSTVATIPPTTDYKKLHNEESAPNTGGLGAICPHPLMTPEIYEKIKEKIIIPTAHGLIDKKIDYKGILYIGIIIKDGEPFVLEYNVRFGDPEIQPILMLLESDLIPIINSCIDGTLKTVTMDWSEESSVCIVAASDGYPGNYKKGFEITGLDDIKSSSVEIFHSGTKKEGDKVITSGGRVLCITAKGPSHEIAIKKAYDAIKKVNFEGIYYRKDIGKFKTGV